jgi:hypothetical protein
MMLTFNSLPFARKDKRKELLCQDSQKRPDNGRFPSGLLFGVMGSMPTPDLNVFSAGLNGYIGF